MAMNYYFFFFLDVFSGLQDRLDALFSDFGELHDCANVIAKKYELKSKRYCRTPERRKALDVRF